MPLDVPPGDLFREGGRWLVRLALWLAVVTSLLTLPSAVSAQQTPPDPAATTMQFDARFVPRDQRKPVPYELAGGTAVIRVSVNGREVWALLDNRSSSTLIDEAFARSLGLQLTAVAGRLFTTTGALQRSRVIELVDLAIPGQVRMRAPVFAADLSGSSAIAGRPISLVVGKEYFDVMLFVFSPRNRQVQLGPSGSLRVAADTPYLALRDDSPQVEVMIAGRPAVLTIDLGYTGEIALSQHAWSRLGMSDLPTRPSMSVDARGWGTDTVTTTVEEVSLGSKRVEDIRISLSPALLVERDGYVGIGLLSRFNFAIDIKARRLWLIPPFPEE